MPARATEGIYHKWCGGINIAQGSKEGVGRRGYMSMGIKSRLQLNALIPPHHKTKNDFDTKKSVSRRKKEYIDD